MRLNMVTGVSPAPARSRNGLPRPRVQVQSDTAKQPRNRLFPPKPPSVVLGEGGKGEGGLLELGGRGAGSEMF